MRLKQIALTLLMVAVFLACLYGVFHNEKLVPNSAVVDSDTLTYYNPAEYDFPRPDSTWQLVEGDIVTVPTSGVYSIMWSNDSVWIKPVK